MSLLSPFIGRDAELSQLDRLIEANRRRFNSPVVITGIGGVGKTALAKTFVNNNFSNDDVAWLDLYKSNVPKQEVDEFITQLHQEGTVGTDDLFTGSRTDTRFEKGCWFTEDWKTRHRNLDCPRQKSPQHLASLIVGAYHTAGHPPFVASAIVSVAVPNTQSNIPWNFLRD